MRCHWISFITYVLVGPMAASAAGPVKVFVLAGQSNMEGKAAASTLKAVIDDPATQERFKHLKPGDNWAVRDDVWVTYLDRKESPVAPRFGPLTIGFGSPKRVRDATGKRRMEPGVGPELGIGWVLGDYFAEPVVLIKAAWGGRALKHTFRPPTAMPTDQELQQHLDQVRKKNPQMSRAELHASYGRDYRKIVKETQSVLKALNNYCPDYDESAGYQLAGFIWFQGWNDGVGKGNPAYTEQLAHFVRDIRKDLNAPGLPFVIGELGIDGPNAKGWVAKFREQQRAVAALPEFEKNVRIAPTAAYWPEEPDLSQEWQAFRTAAKANESKPKDDPTRVNPGAFYQQNWLAKYQRQLAFTSDKRYHYRGSGRCYYQMGQSMARAMIELLD